MKNVILYGAAADLASVIPDLPHSMRVKGVCADDRQAVVSAQNLPQLTMAELSGLPETEYDQIVLITRREGVAYVYQRRLEMAGIDWRRIVYERALRARNDTRAKISILVSYRLDIPSVIVPNPLYLPVRSGAYFDKAKDSRIRGDDTGENISRYQHYFSELSVQYWGWKNIEADYYGLCHYRRYLSFSKQSYPLNERAFIVDPCLDVGGMARYGLLDEARMRRIITRHDAIVNIPADVRRIRLSQGCMPTVYSHWQAHDGIFFDARALDILLEGIKTYAADYLEDAHAYFGDVWHRGYNCFVMKRMLFHRLCQLQENVLSPLFPVLEKNGYLRKYPRTPAYLGEILYGIFVYHMQKEGADIAERPLVLFDETRLRPFVPGRSAL